MIKGMTGFGSSSFSSGNLKGALEIKTVNHRYFDIVFYLPPGFAAAEDKIRQVISKQVERGRITVSVKITERPQVSLVFNKNVVHEYLKYAKVLQKEYNLPNDLALSDLMRMPGVVDAKEAILDSEHLWPVLDRSLGQALDSLVHMRKREGKSLYRDIAGLLSRMLQQITIIRRRAESVLKEKKKALPSEEFSAFQKSNDINEELARLAHYVDEFKLLLRAEVSVGKNMDFVAQEMQRETNTVGSKLQDKIVANAVIALKSKIEKLREQAQNIE
jgi:uncharacterized protein (TIGR00255 family)